MILTWKDFILIIENMFEITPEEIAEKLKVSASTISRLKSGETKRFTAFGKDKVKANEEIYNKLFDPNNKESPAATNGKEEKLLSLLKEILAEAGFSWVMDDLLGKEYEQGDYKRFVVKMLERINKRQPKRIDVLLRYSTDAAAQRSREGYWNSKSG